MSKVLEYLIEFYKPSSNSDHPFATEHPWPTPNPLDILANLAAASQTFGSSDSCSYVPLDWLLRAAHRAYHRAYQLEDQTPGAFLTCLKDLVVFCECNPPSSTRVFCKCPPECECPPPACECTPGECECTPPACECYPGECECPPPRVQLPPPACKSSSYLDKEFEDEEERVATGLQSVQLREPSERRV